MGINNISYFSSYFSKTYEKDESQKEEDSIKSPKLLESLELKNEVELGKDNIIYEIKQFPSGSIIITTQNGKIIYFDKTLKNKIEIKNNNDEKNKICIKNDFIFATHNKSIIKVWSIENINQSKIKISLKEEIDTKFIKKIKQISFINDDIIGIKLDELFYYIKNKNQKYDTYERSNNISLKSDESKNELYSFILTKDDKEIILAKYHYIYVYQIEPFQIITIIKEDVCLTKKRLFLIDEHSFGCDNKTMIISTALEPANVLQIFNLKNKKLIIEASLDDYAVMYFRWGKFFVSPSFCRYSFVNIYTFKDLEERNKLNKNNSEKSHENIPKKLRYESIFRPRFYSLNENLLYIYGKCAHNFLLYKFIFS